MNGKEKGWVISWLNNSLESVVCTGIVSWRPTRSLVYLFHSTQELWWSTYVVCIKSTNIVLTIWLLPSVENWRSREAQKHLYNSFPHYENPAFSFLARSWPVRYIHCRLSTPAHINGPQFSKHVSLAPLFLLNLFGRGSCVFGYHVCILHSQLSALSLNVPLLFNQEFEILILNIDYLTFITAMYEPYAILVNSFLLLVFLKVIAKTIVQLVTTNI